MPHDPARVAETREWLQKAVLDPAVPLTEFAWAFRYPGDHPTPTREEARQGFETARRTVAAVAARLPEDAVPTSLRDQIY